MRNLRSIPLRPVVPLVALLVVASWLGAPSSALASPATRDDVERARLALAHLVDEADRVERGLGRLAGRLRATGRALDAARTELRAARRLHGAQALETRAARRAVRAVERRRDALRGRHGVLRDEALRLARSRAVVVGGLDLETRRRALRAVRADAAADPVERFLAAVAAEPRAGSSAGALTDLDGDAAPAPSGIGAVAAAHALTQVGVPYRAAGASPETGFDCSGLLYWAFAQAGLAIPRSSGDIWAAGARVPIDRLAPGDIVSFRDQGHVGIYLGGGLYVHSTESGDVVSVDPIERRDDLDGAVRLGA
jgi:cell wall-associated NlpC family hydrolase